MKKITALILVMLAVAMFLLPTDAAVVSEQAEYSLITPASEAYPDDGAKLTDGVFATLPDGASGYYSSGYYVGFNQANVDGDGNYEIGDQNDLYEYREDGTQERITVWNRNSISDGSGLVTIVPGGSGIGVYIPGDPLTKDYYKNVYEFDDKENLITASGYDDQDSIKESFKITYDENGNMVSKEQYDADGNVISTVEYDEDGNKINE